VRFTVINGVQYLSVRDLISVICGKTNKEASQTWIRDINNEQKAELSSFCGNFQFPGRGQSEQPEGAQKITNSLLTLSKEQFDYVAVFAGARASPAPCR
jgi:hypothetical protein